MFAGKCACWQGGNTITQHAVKHPEWCLKDSSACDYCRQQQKLNLSHWTGLVHSGALNFIADYACSLHFIYLFILYSVFLFDSHMELFLSWVYRNKDMWLTFSRQVVTNWVANCCERRYTVNYKVSKELLLNFRFTDPSNSFFSPCQLPLVYFWNRVGVLLLRHSKGQLQSSAADQVHSRPSLFSRSSQPQLSLHNSKYFSHPPTPPGVQAVNAHQDTRTKGLDL